MVEIKDSSVATLAAEWCKQKDVPYCLEFAGWPSNTRYKFTFNNEQDLIMFSLKWV